MAQITITKLNDGPRFGIFHVAILGDGSGELSKEVVIDPAVSFDKAIKAAPTLTIESLRHDLVGFNARLEFDYLESDTPAWSMSGGTYAKVKFCDFGGIKDRSNPLDGTGKLTITTDGLGAGDHGAIIIKVRKD